MQKYHITDVDLFIEGTRLLVYQTFGHKEDDIDIESISLDMKDLNKEQTKEIDECLNKKDCDIIVKEFLRKTKRGFIITEENYIKFIEALNLRMVSNLLSGLTQKGLLETAFDEESNDFIFWAKEDGKKNKKPKT